jgi:gas vesicle protein
MRQIFGFFVGMFAGWLVGGTIALLLAPSTGEDLRNQIQSRATGFVDEVKGAAEERRIALEHHLEELRHPHQHQYPPAAG